MTDATSVQPNLAVLGGAGWVVNEGYTRGAITRADEDFGASPSASGAQNTARINAALARTGVVTLTKPGTYTLAHPNAKTTVSGANPYNVALIIYSGTHLLLGPGVLLKTADGVVNPVMIQNSDIIGGNGNIIVEGGQWDNNAANGTRTDGATFAAIAMWFQGVTNLRLRNVEMRLPLGWGIGIANCRHVLATETYFAYTGGVMGVGNRGGFQCQGANSSLTFLNTRGVTYDDMVAVVSDDYGVYANAMAGPGAVSDVIIDGVTSHSTAGCWQHVRLLDSVANPMSRVSVSNVKGPYSYQSASLGPAVSAGNTSKLNDISFCNIDVSQLATSSTGLGTIGINGAFANIDIYNIHRTVQIGEGFYSLVSLSGGQTATRLGISGASVQDLNTASATAFPLISVVTASTFIGCIQLSNVHYNGANTTTADGVVIKTAASTTVQKIEINNINLNRVSNILNLAGAVTIGAHISNVEMANPNAAPIVQSGANACALLQLTNINQTGTGGTALVSFTGVTGTPLVQLNNVQHTNAVSIARSAAETIRAQSITTPIPSTVLTPNRGDVILDSTSNNDPFRWNGAAWAGL